MTPYRQALDLLPLLSIAELNRLRMDAIPRHLRSRAVREEVVEVVEREVEVGDAKPERFGHNRPADRNGEAT
jgi:hypothetical protein